ncbi:MAG: SOS response-associated peptidase [Actinobacteria bacterium]|nr:SOS response-associated peptidase [Actinomycetota bacterium]
MCGRYTSTTPIADLARFFSVDRVVADDLGPRYNVAPTEDVYTVAVRGDETRLGALRWGLVPGWADSPTLGSRLINARAETLLDKPAFRAAFARRRCLVPADGFYEWQLDTGGAKQPWYIPSSEGSPLALAGLWESWRPPGARVAAIGADGRGGGGGKVDRLVSCAIVTTVANDALAPIHSRMPAILAPEDWASWLDPDNDDVEELPRLLAPAPGRWLAPRMVRPLVNAVANDGPELIEPLDVLPPEPAPPERRPAPRPAGRGDDAPEDERSSRSG